MASFEDRIIGLAAEMGKTYPLVESELAVKSIETSVGELIKGTEGNMKSRLVLEEILRRDASRFPHTNVAPKTFETAAREIFGEELWDDTTKVHPMINIFKTPWRVSITWKPAVLTAHAERVINEAWEHRADIGTDTEGSIRSAVATALAYLDEGRLRVVESRGDEWVTSEWLKKAVLLSFRLNPNECITGGPGDSSWWDKVPTKFVGWNAESFTKAGLRAVPGSVVRRGAYIGKDVVLMPSLVNIGAYVGDGTMIDTWATVGSCAQIGKKCHISGGAGIGGVLEPLQATPVIIEDECFIGARSEVAEGVIVRKGAALSMGVFIGKDTPIVDRTDGNKIIRGYVPSNAVVLMGVHPENGLICPQIMKYRDAQTDGKTAINEMLRS